MMDFGRVITAMVTPFDSQLKVDVNKFEQLIDYLIVEQGSDSLVISGTTGESPTLTDDEKIQLFEIAVRRAAGRCKIIAGTGSNDTAHSIHLTKEAQRIGVDGILLVAPYYNRPTQEGLYQHFKAIAEITHLPIMLYNVPSRTSVNISAETTLRLAREFRQIVATKEANDDFTQITNIIKQAPEGFRLYSGDDEITLPILAVGGYGVVSVVSHIVGRDLRAMIEAHVSGHVREAASIHGQLLPIFKGMFHCPHPCPNPVPMKYALRLHGMDVGGVRLPLVQLNEQEQQFISALFKQ